MKYDFIVPGIMFVIMIYAKLINMRAIKIAMIFRLIVAYTHVFWDHSVAKGLKKSA